LKKDRDKAKRNSEEDSVDVSKEIKEHVMAGVDGGNVHKLDELTKKKKEESDKTAKKVAEETEKKDEEMVSAIPDVDVSEDPSMHKFAKRFLANIADAHLEVSKDELKEIEKDLNRMNIATSTTILRCKGPKDCVYGKMCALSSSGKYPKGNLCPLEKTIAEIYFGEYLQSLNLSIDDMGIIEFNQIMSLIECDLLDMRARCKLNEEGMTRMVTTFINSRTGDTAENEDLSLMFAIKEKVSKRRDILLKQLLATPEIRAKYKVASLADKERKDARQLAKSARAKLIEIRGKENGDGKKQQGETGTS